MGFALKSAAVVMLILSLNLQWAILQTVAWTGMVISYSRSASFATALEMTLDGKHPCALCKAVKAGRAAEKRQDSRLSKVFGELDLGLIWERTEFYFTCDTPRIAALDFYLVSRSEAPPRPPPRGLLPYDRPRV